MQRLLLMTFTFLFLNVAWADEPIWHIPDELNLRDVEVDFYGDNEFCEYVLNGIRGKSIDCNSVRLGAVSDSIVPTTVIWGRINSLVIRNNKVVEISIKPDRTVQKLSWLCRETDKSFYSPTNRIKTFLSAYALAKLERCY